MNRYARLRSSTALVPLLLGSALVARGAAELPEALPEEVGIDSARLVELSRVLRERQLDVRSLLVVRRGKLVFERYAKGVTREHNHAVYSVTKSVSATLVGILLRQGKLDGVQVPLVDVLPRERYAKLLEDKREIRLRDALWMASGLEWVEHPTDTPLYRAPDRLAVALAPAPAHEPGEKFNYSNADAEMVGAVIHELSGTDGLRFAAEHLFEPLGMENWDWWYADRRGRYPGGWALRLRTIDMAKLGLLWLRGGTWNGDTIVDETWIEQATKPGAVPYYGSFFWLGTLDRDPSHREFSARGWKGQFIVVVPALDLVLAMSSVLPADQEGPVMTSMLKNFILPAVRKGKKPLETTPERAAALREELALSSRTGVRPGQAVDEQDEPRR